MIIRNKPHIFTVNGLDIKKKEEKTKRKIS